ncbi:unnamed protein product, partial [Ranitomeya imitator]
TTLNKQEIGLKGFWKCFPCRTITVHISMSGISLDHSVIRWCCISSAELRKCEDWALSIRSDPLVCVQATSLSGCIEMIKSNEADAVTLDATHAYIAGRCGLQPAAVEYWGDHSDCLGDPKELLQGLIERGFPPLYAVAVSKKSMKAVNLLDLGGRRSCHGSLYSPAGWLLLSRYTVRAAVNETWDCDLNSGFLVVCEHDHTDLFTVQVAHVFLFSYSIMQPPIEYNVGPS